MQNTWKVAELCLFVVIVLLQISSGVGTLWSEWWTYHGISGTQLWGKANKDWIICSKGKYQSPINIDPTSLVHDPHLTQLSTNHNKLKGVLVNTGQDLKLVVKETDTNPFIFTGGPLSYQYTLFEIKLHFGDNNSKGSEHSIGGKKFPLEIQLYGYNGEIHKNSTQALYSPNGIAVIVILALLNEEDNINFDALIKLVDKVRYKGSSIPVSGFFVNTILPSLDYFLTYEGSLTQPGCMETVTWVILNKPLHISHSQLHALRAITKSEGGEHPLMINNFRDLTPVHGRLIRTNIKSKVKEREGMARRHAKTAQGKHYPDDDCYTMKLTSYEVNEKFKQKT